MALARIHGGITYLWLYGLESPAEQQLPAPAEFAIDFAYGAKRWPSRLRA